MKCPICDAFHRERDLLCQIEAAAVLQQRQEMIKPVESPEFDYERGRTEIILASRKRQARIATWLEYHRAEAHAG